MGVVPGERTGETGWATAGGRKALKAETTTLQVNATKSGLKRWRNREAEDDGGERVQENESSEYGLGCLVTKQFQ